jgi:hypothetical protein
MSNPFDDPEVVIVRYTRGQALADGVLVDVSEWANSRGMMGGFRIPVAMSAAVWAKVEAPKGSTQDTRGRAHDVLWMASLAARRQIDSDRASFTVRLGRGNVPMWIHVGPGDNAEPVATIMLEGED